MSCHKLTPNACGWTQRPYKPSGCAGCWTLKMCGETRLAIAEQCVCNNTKQTNIKPYINS